VTSRTDWDIWRAKRLATVVSPTGNLALIETRWQEGDQEISLEESLMGLPKTVSATREERIDFAGHFVQRGIRLWDANSLAIRSFETIDVYPFDPNWIFESTFIPHPESRAVPFEYVRETPEMRDLAVPGEIKFTIDGVNYALDAFDDDGTLLLVFADPTNGAETYPAGRFLFVYRTPATNQVKLDFNRAFVPPCGFSVHYNCPLPPPQNRLQVPVRAGEKFPIFGDNYQIH
jgi:uncharacterized protein (DUF1684 family)